MISLYFVIIFTFFPLVFPAVRYSPQHKLESSLEMTNSENQIISFEDILTDFSRKDIQCRLSPSLKKEIQSYQLIVNKIVDVVTNGFFKGKVYEELAYFTDKFGSRISGSQNLENSIDYMIDSLKKHNLEAVHGEAVLVPNWIRGEEQATMISPRYYKFGILGLGGTVSTPPNGITAEALVVSSFDDLHKKSDQAKGKIIIFNEDWISYGESVKYRTHGAIEGAKVGGLAALVRSVTPFSLYTLHTGEQDCIKNITCIPTASITIEDAQLFKRLSDRGEKIVIHLIMQSETKPDQISRNIVADVVGRNKKEEIVLVSGHIDSWDVGQGAVDDGAGAFVSWYSLYVLKSLGLRPRRTVRALLWTAEEPGLIGVRQYVKSHAAEMDNFDLVMESDEGTFTPKGIEFAGTKDAACIMQEVAKLMGSLNATDFKVLKYVSSDITEFTNLGVPAADLATQNENYFWFHHTNADTMTALNSDDLDRNVAMFSAISYVIADISIKLPNSVKPLSILNKNSKERNHNNYLSDENIGTHIKRIFKKKWFLNWENSIMRTNDNFNINESENSVH